MKTEIDFKKKLVITLDIRAYSSFGLSEKELADLVAKDLPSTIKARLDYMGGECGCSNDGKAFGYKFEPKGFSIDNQGGCIL